MCLGTCYVAEPEWLDHPMVIPLVNPDIALRVKDTTVVPANSYIFAICEIPESQTATQWIIEPSICTRGALRTARTVSDCLHGTKNIKVCVANWDQEDITMNPGAFIAYASPSELSDVHACQVQTLDDSPKRWYTDYNRFVHDMEVHFTETKYSDMEQDTSKPTWVKMDAPQYTKPPIPFAPTILPATYSIESYEEYINAMMEKEDVNRANIGIAPFKCKVVTDCRALAHWNTSKQIPSKVEEYLSEINSYGADFEHRPAAKIPTSDTTSRYERYKDPPFSEEEIEALRKPPEPNRFVWNYTGKHQATVQTIPAATAHILHVQVDNVWDEQQAHRDTASLIRFMSGDRAKFDENVLHRLSIRAKSSR